MSNSKETKPMDNATVNTAANQKLEPTLRAAMDATPGELAESENLSTGFTPETGLWEVIVLYSGSGDALLTAFPDFSITLLLGNYAIVRLPEAQLNAFAAAEQIIYVEKPKRLFFEILSGKRASCITPLQTGSLSPSPSAFPTPNLTGQGILVAVIDSGIDYTHPDFRTTDGNTRILELWDQTVAPDPSRNFQSPEGYSLGTVFSRETINEALQAQTEAERRQLVPSADLSGHGTHVTGIAAGNGRASDGVYQGVAYESDLIIVKLGTPDPKGFPSTPQLMQAVNYCMEKSIAYNRPIVINLSFGNTYGSHSGTSLLETYLDSVSGLGRVSIVCGSGNEGSSAGHAAGVLRENESRRIEFAVSDYERSLSIQLWKNYWDEIRFSIQPPSGSSPIVIPDTPGSFRFRADGTELLVYYGEPSPYSRYQEIYIELLGAATASSAAPSTTAYIAPGVWNLQLSAQRVADGIYDLWMPVASIRGLGTQFLTPTPDTTLTIPSTASGVVTVGAYDSYSNTPAPFSGRGYTWNTNQVKPDLVAPGVDITSCSPGGGYETLSGTSMATPFVTGSCALLMQWGILYGNDPFLYGEKMKAYLIRGARRLPIASTYPNPSVGWGALCVRDSLPF